MAVNVHTYESPNLITKHVTVFTDRAEVKKIIPATKLNAGLNEIVIKKLTRSIEPDSIRVEGFGKSVICEVKYQEKHVKKEEDKTSNEKDLLDKLKVLRENQNQMNQKLQRFTKQKNVLEGIANQIGSISPNQCYGESENKSCPSGGLALLSDVNLETLESFLGFYSQRSASVDKDVNELKKEMQKINEEIRVIEKNLRPNYNDEQNLSREVSIIVQTDQAESAEFNLSYLVHSAKWTPSYDLRVSSNEKLFKLYYYGMISQNTKEDWKDVKVSLSTAMPKIGGQVPELKTLKVGFYKPPPPPPEESPRAMPMAFCMAAMPMQDTQIRQIETIQEMGMEMRVAVTEVKESVISTSFDIPNTTTIPSDDTSHKVTIAIVDLKADFHYETVPSKSTFAYLKAKVVNTSKYAFLPGPAAVFLDNSFVAKTSLKAVSPSEEFNCSLGVDPAVRIEYKPAKNFHEETGLLTRSSVETREQKIEIKNTKSDTIIVTVIEHLPLSGEEKIKINLLEPNPNRNDKGFSFKTNKNNNLEFEVVIPKNETRVAIVKYSVEYPKSEKLEYKEE